MLDSTDRWTRASAEDVRRLGCIVAHVDGHTLALFADGETVRAVDNRDFHTIQMLEAAFRQYELTGDGSFLIAAARYLAAHAPTVRAQGQTYHIARRLHRGERLYEDE